MRRKITIKRYYGYFLLIGVLFFTPWMFSRQVPSPIEPALPSSHLIPESALPSGGIPSWPKIDFMLFAHEKSVKGNVSALKGQFLYVRIHTDLGVNLFYKKGEFKLIIQGRYHYEEYSPKLADQTICLDIRADDYLNIWVENYEVITGLLGWFEYGMKTTPVNDYILQNDIPMRIYPSAIENTRYRYYFAIETPRNFEITYSIQSENMKITESRIGPLTALQQDDDTNPNVQILQAYSSSKRTISANGKGWWAIDLTVPECTGKDEIILRIKWGNEPPQIQGQKAMKFRTNDPRFANKPVAWKLTDYSTENATYMIWMNNTLVWNGTWTNLDTVGVELTNQTPGEYNYRIGISDGLGLNNTADTEVCILASLIFSWGTEKYEIICMSLAFGPIALVMIRDLLVKHLRKKYADEFPEDTSGAVLMTHAVGDQGFRVIDGIRRLGVGIKECFKSGIQGLRKLITKYRQQRHSPDPQRSRQGRQEAL